MRKFISAIVFIFIIIGIYLYEKNKLEKNYEKAYNNEMIGIISNIRFDAKTNAIVRIGILDYHLSLYRIRKSNNFREGDSIHKNRNSKYLKHYRRNSQGFYLDDTYELKK